MLLVVNCPNCQSRVPIEEELLGEPITCPICVQSFVAARPPNRAKGGVLRYVCPVLFVLWVALLVNFYVFPNDLAFWVEAVIFNIWFWCSILQLSLRRASRPATTAAPSTPSSTVSVAPVPAAAGLAASALTSAASARRESSATESAASAYALKLVYPLLMTMFFGLFFCGIFGLPVVIVCFFLSVVILAGSQMLDVLEMMRPRATDEDWR